jgi:protein-S-isoprenylcysteine O-methyltransferase Ste14
MLTLFFRSAVATLVISVVVATVLFTAAWTTHFSQAWIFVAELFAIMTATNGYLLKTAPDLLERRLPSNRESQPRQRVAIASLRAAALAMFATAGLDHRLHWSHVPSWLTAIAFAVLTAGALLVFLVMRENRFASLTIDVAPEQRVIATGPYQCVRHPMYLGALAQAFAVPLALGSYSAETFSVLACIVVIGRLLAEESLLSASLPGYSDYMQCTRYRLIPGVW